jgi:hypothetical protein
MSWWSSPSAGTRARAIAGIRAVGRALADGPHRSGRPSGLDPVRPSMQANSRLARRGKGIERLFPILVAQA